MEPLAALDRSSLWGPRRIALDRLLDVYDEYLAARDIGTSAGKSGTGASLFATTDRSAASRATLWPNPATTRLHVRVPDGGADIAVYDVTGRRVASLLAQTGDRATWDLRAGGSRVAAGLYQVVVTARDGSRHTRTATVR